MCDYKEENPNCRDTYAVFQLVGERLDPDEVSRCLHTSPSFGFSKQSFSKMNGGLLRSPTGLWAISSESQLRTTCLNRHLLLLLDRLEPHKATLFQLTTEQGLAACFFCRWETSMGHGGPVLPPETLRRISELNAVLELDYHGLPGGGFSDKLFLPFDERGP
jgi:hypothetical protein